MILLQMKEKWGLLWWIPQNPKPRTRKKKKRSLFGISWRQKRLIHRM